MTQSTANTYSLRRRLILAASGLLCVFFGLMGFFLYNAFKQSVLDTAQLELKNTVLILASAIDIDSGKIMVPSPLPEPRLNQVDSGLYAQVSTQANEWQSNSLAGDVMTRLDSSVGEYQFFETTDWQDGTYSMTLDVLWELDETEFPVNFLVAMDNTPYLNRINNYQRNLVLWLFGLGLVLLLLQLALLGWALKPLRRVMQQVSEVEQGKRKLLDKDYPEEVARLTESVNQLIEHEDKRINQHKLVLGNLAHSLKTPLAILRGMTFSNEQSNEVNSQLGAMQEIIDYQLNSASAIERRRFLQAIEVAEMSQQTISTLQKLYTDKPIHLTQTIDQGALFYGEKGDWMEVLGNLLDNAYKWARHDITVSIRNVSDRKLELIVSDDGPGITEEAKEKVMQRGMRLDSQTSGHGLGLDIVRNIVDAYQGSYEITDRLTDEIKSANAQSTVDKHDACGTKVTIIL